MSGFEGGSVFPRFRLSADLLTSPRTLFAMAAAGRLPRQLAAVNRRFGSPAVAIVMHTATAAALAIKADFNTLTTLASSALLLIYFMSAVRLIVLQRRKIGEDRVVFRLPGGPVIPLAATILVLGLIRALAWHEIVALLVPWHSPGSPTCCLGFAGFPNRHRTSQSESSPPPIPGTDIRAARPSTNAPRPLNGAS